jgi:flagellar basal-body rod protein FlgF
VNSGLYTAVSGLRAQMEALDVLSNNLANLNTTGFKEEKTFYALLNSTMESNEAGELGSVINNQSVLAQRMTNLTDGSLQVTQRELDLALTGNGFLTVETPRGIRYTRNGSLALDSKSVLCTAEGFPVLGENGRITLGSGRIDINREGEVSLNGTRVDRLKLAAFDNSVTLTREGGSLLTPAEDTAKPKSADAEVRQGYLEQSNVNPISSVIGMVGIMRQYESIQKSVQVIMNDMNAKCIERIAR